MRLVAIVKPAGSRYVLPRTSKIGAGGTYVLRFHAVAEGKTRLKLDYVQSGRTKARPAKTFVLGVVVKPAA